MANRLTLETLSADTNKIPRQTPDNKTVELALVAIMNFAIFFHLNDMKYPDRQLRRSTG